MTDADAVAKSLPKQFSVSVVLECRKSTVNRWATKQWSAIAVMLDSQIKADADTPIPLHIDEQGYGQYLWGQLLIQLYQDETESYYQNLRADNPGLFVVCQDEGQGIPKPVLVSASFDEAGSYMETDEQVFKVPIPPPMYTWIEAFVVAYHLPQAVKKRRRKRWNKEDSR